MRAALESPPYERPERVAECRSCSNSERSFNEFRGNLITAISGNSVIPEMTSFKG